MTQNILIPAQTDIELKDIDELDRLIMAMIQPAVEMNMKREDWRPISDAMESEHEKYFDRAASPAGEPWEPLAPFTVAKKGHATILIEDGILRQSLTESGSPAAVRELSLDEIVFGTRREHAEKHQDGYGKIPQRSHTGFSENLVDEVVDLVTDTIIGKMVVATP